MSKLLNSLTHSGSMMFSTPHTFLNAKIVGGRVHATAWELLCSMLLMEAVFGLGGLVAAPVVYAWIKSELKAKEMI